MKLRSIAVAVAALALTGNAFAQDIASEKGKLSYYFGYDYGNNLAELTGRGEQLDINSVVKGLQDAYAKKQPAITAHSSGRRRMAEYMASYPFIMLTSSTEIEPRLRK